MTWFLEKMLLDGESIDARLEHNVVTGEHTRTMNGASTVDLTIHDPDRVLTKSGVFTHIPKKKLKRKDMRFQGASHMKLGETTLILDGNPYRLSGYSKNGSNVELRFEDEIVALMRQHKKPLVTSRKTLTRAQFIRYRLVAAVKDRRIATNFPGLSKRRPQEDPDIPKRELSKAALITIKGQPADKDQRKNIDIVMQAIERNGAGEKASLAMIAGIIGESGFRSNIRNLEGSGAQGVFQIMPRYHHLVPPGDVALGADVFLNVGFTNLPNSASAVRRLSKSPQPGGAIKVAQNNPYLTPGGIASKMEGSGMPASFYDAHVPEARAIIDAGGGFGGTQYVPDPEGNVYSVGDLDWRPGDGERENYWDGAARLAEEVNYNLFVANNTLYYARDADLFRSAPVAMVAEQPSKEWRNVGIQYVGNIDFDTHYNKRVEEATFSARANQMFAFPGATIELFGVGAASGKYLIEEIRDTIGSADVEITCRRPAPQKPEPAPPVIGIPKTDFEATPVSVRSGDLVYPLPVPGTFNGGVAAHKARARGNWQSDNAVDINVPMGTPVLAVESGTIVKLGGSWSGGQGNPDGFNVTLQGSSNTWFYTHLRNRLPLTVGMTVTVGQRLGTSGAGNGVPHLHIASIKGNPELLLGVGRPFPNQNLADKRERERKLGREYNPRGAYG